MGDFLNVLKSLLLQNVSKTILCSSYINFTPKLFLYYYYF